jgi:predicted ester cyclase
MSEPNRVLAMHFITQQDRLKGGPDESLCAVGYTAQVNGRKVDLAGHRELATHFYAAFPDLNHVIEDTVADAEHAAVRYVLHGTHEADFMGIKPTGKRITAEGISILMITDGKVTESRGVVDMQGILQQLVT